jgi:hypothetical protein
MPIIFLRQKLFCLSWIKIQNSWLISVTESISITDQQLQFIHPRQVQKCSELSQYLLKNFPIPYWYRIHCLDRSEVTICDRIATSNWNTEIPGNHATFPLKIVEFPGQTALYFLLGKHYHKIQLNKNECNISLTDIYLSAQDEKIEIYSA